MRYSRRMQAYSEKVFYVYMTASKPRGVIDTRMTSDLPGRIGEHRERSIDGFTKRYWVDRLVYFEPHDDVEVAQRREWLLKRWRRDWKIELIEKTNPTWRDLYPEALHLDGFEP
jgi:putative endonuclease